MSTTLKVGGVEITQDMSEFRFIDEATGVETVSMLTANRYITDSRCTSVTVAVDDESSVGPTHGESIASSFGAQVSSLSGMVAISKETSSPQCGGDDMSANAARFAVDNSAKSLLVHHCPCDLDDCVPGSGKTTTSGENCVFSRKSITPIAAGDCGAEDSAGMGKKTCVVGGLVYSSNILSGTTNAFAPAVTLSCHPPLLY